MVERFHSCPPLSQAAVCRAEDVGGRVQGDQSELDGASQSSDGEGHHVVPEALGQVVPAGGREALRAGGAAPPTASFLPRPPASPQRFPAAPPQISIPLSTAFGADTEGAQWIVGYLLEKVINNLSVWSSEAELANDTVELLVTLVEKRER